MGGITCASMKSMTCILLPPYFISLKLSSSIACRGDLVISTSTQDVKDSFGEVGVLKDQHLSTAYVVVPTLGLFSNPTSVPLPHAGRIIPSTSQRESFCTCPWT